MAGDDAKLWLRLHVRSEMQVEETCRRLFCFSQVRCETLQCLVSVQNEILLEGLELRVV